MNSKPILIVAGEPNSIFLEIFFKALKYKKFKTPLILIGSHKLLVLQMKYLNLKKKIHLIDFRNIKVNNLNNKSINLINIEYNANKPFEKISNKSNSYIKDCFEIAFKLIAKGTTDKLINGPI